MLVFYCRCLCSLCQKIILLKKAHKKFCYGSIFGRFVDISTHLETHEESAGETM